VLAGTYTSRAPVRFSSDATSAMWMSWSFTSENNTRLLPNQARPVAFARNGRGWPLMTGTTHVSPHSTPGLTVYAMRSPSGENAGLILEDWSRVSWTGSPSGSVFT
jgi:hypothetical protein